MINFDATEEAILTCIINGEVTSKSSYTKAKRRASERESLRLSSKSSIDSYPNISTSTSIGATSTGREASGSSSRGDSNESDDAPIAHSQSESAIARGESGEFSENFPDRATSTTASSSTRQQKAAVRRQMYPVIEKGKAKPLSKLATLKAAPHVIVLVLDTSSESFQKIVDVVSIYEYICVYIYKFVNT